MLYAYRKFLYNIDISLKWTISNNTFSNKYEIHESKQNIIPKKCTKCKITINMLILQDVIKTLSFQTYFSIVAFKKLSENF